MKKVILGVVALAAVITTISFGVSHQEASIVPIDTVTHSSTMTVSQ